MGALLASAEDILRRRGVVGLLAQARAALRYELRYTRWRLDIDDWRPGVAPPSELDIRHGSLAELGALRGGWRGEPLAREFYADRIDGARWFYLARRNGAIAHISWLHTADARTPLIRLGRGEVEVRRVYTMKTHRGRSVFTYVLDHIVHDLRAAGVRVAWAHVEPSNEASSRTFAAAGFRPVGTVRLVKRFGVIDVDVVSAPAPGAAAA